MLNKNDLKELISAARQNTTLVESVIEKDYFVTRAIATVSQIENPFFRLIFSGGTSLAKAHKIIGRMSEDIDFKISYIHQDEPLSRSGIKKEAKILRETMLSVFKGTEFTFDDGDINVKNEGRNISMNVQYPSVIAHKSSGLRPHLLLEFTFSTPRRSIIELQVKTLIQEILDNTINLEKCTVPCVSVNETISEKWVGLTRRTAAINRGYLGEDDYLIRHLYDIATVNSKNKIEDDFYTLVRDIVQQDASQFKTQHPEYHADPYQEINHSLALLESDTHWRNCYENFLGVMVFNNKDSIEYLKALEILKTISAKVQQG